jgi:hypothetical protein
LLLKSKRAALVYSVAALSAAALGITAAEKIFKKKSDKENEG